jgi:ATP-binding cassette subfamily B protein
LNSRLVTAILFLEIGSFLLSRKLIDLSDKSADKEAELSGQITDSISNSNNVRIFGRKTFEISRLTNFLFERTKAFRDLEFAEIILALFQGSMIALMFVGMLFFLVKLYVLNQVSEGDFALILNLSMDAIYITWFCSFLVKDLIRKIGECKQALKSLIIPYEIKENSKNLQVLKGEIKFENVDFGYSENNLIFSNKSVVIPAGQKIGLVGSSGAGKTSFINLILRLYDVHSGKILIDDQDISDVSFDSLYQNIGTVSQDSSLFHRSIMENIRYGKIDSTDEEVFEASKLAGAHEFITALKDGYESSAMERGIKLSGGQRQRIGIARAILKNAPILILDEATSALDSITENFIQKSF